MDQETALRRSQELLGMDAEIWHDPAIAKPYRVGRGTWLFRSTEACGESWADMIEQLELMLRRLGRHPESHVS